MIHLIYCTVRVSDAHRAQIRAAATNVERRAQPQMSLYRLYLLTDRRDVPPRRGNPCVNGDVSATGTDTPVNTC
jgi:hypothetical protein